MSWSAELGAKYPDSHDFKLAFDMLCQKNKQPVGLLATICPIDNSTMMKISRVLSQLRKNLRAVTYASAIGLFVLMSPWYLNVPYLEKSLLIGLPLSYFIALFIVPAIAVFVLITQKNTAEDIDRHTLEFENE